MHQIKNIFLLIFSIFLIGCESPSDKHWRTEDEKKIQLIKNLIIKGRKYATERNYPEACDALRTANFYGLVDKKPTYTNKVFHIDAESYNLGEEMCNKSINNAQIKYATDQFSKAEAASLKGDFSQSCSFLENISKTEQILVQARKLNSNFDRIKNDWCTKRDLKIKQDEAANAFIQAKDLVAKNQFIRACEKLNDSHILNPNLYNAGSSTLNYKNQICGKALADIKSIDNLKIIIERNKSSNNFQLACNNAIELEKILSTDATVKIKEDTCNIEYNIAFIKHSSNSCQRIKPAQNSCALVAGTLLQYPACMKIKYGNDYTQSIETECEKASKIVSDKWDKLLKPLAPLMQMYR